MILQRKWDFTRLVSYLSPSLSVKPSLQPLPKLCQLQRGSTKGKNQGLLSWPIFPLNFRLEQIESMGGSFLYRILYPISWKVKAFGREGHYALWARRYFTGRPWRSNEYKSVPWVGLIWTSDTRANIVIFRTFSFRWRSSLIRWL